MKKCLSSILENRAAKIQQEKEAEAKRIADEAERLAKEREREEAISQWVGVGKFILGALFSSSSHGSGKVHVKSYHRRDGTFVRSHYRKK